MKYFLRQIERGNSNPLQIDLLTNEVIVGRSTKVELTKYGQVSRRHASFVKVVENNTEQWYVKDLGSLNGIYVNGFKIKQGEQSKIEIGDHIGFGIPNTEVEGFVCTLSVRETTRVNRTIEVIDLSRDEPIVIKSEPKEAEDPVTTHRESASLLINSVSGGLHSPLLSANSTCDKSAVNCGASYSRNSKECSDVSVPLSDSDKNNKTCFVQNVKHSDLANTSSAIVNNGGPPSLPEINSTRPLMPFKSNNTGKGTESFCGPSSNGFVISLSDDESSTHAEQTTSSYFQSDPCCSKDIRQNGVANDTTANATKVGHSKTNIDIQGVKKANYEKAKAVSSCLEKENSLQKAQQNLFLQKSVKSATNQEGRHLSKESPHSESYLIKNSISAVEENSRIALQLKKCHIPLTRCDSNNFVWPDNVRPQSHSISNSVNDPKSKGIGLKQRKKAENKRGAIKSGPESSTSIKHQLSSSKKASHYNSVDNPKLSSEASNKQGCLSSESKSQLAGSENHLEVVCRPIVETRSQMSIDNENNTGTNSVPIQSIDLPLENRSAEPVVAENLIDDADMEFDSSDKEDNFGYSQIEEVILISDDESYFDFNTSQVIIKEESLDEDLDHEIFGRPYDEDGIVTHSGITDDQENVSDYLNDSLSANSSESIGSIRKYIESTSSTSVEKRNPDDNVVKTSDVEIGDYFPMSQINTYDEDSDGNSEPVEAIPQHNDDSDSSVSSLDYTIEPSKNKPIESKVVQSNGRKRVSKIKSVGKIMLTLPKSMEPRPKRLRGKEEGFEEKQMPSPVKLPTTKLSSKKVNSPKPKTPVKNKKRNSLRKVIENKNVLGAYKIPKKTMSSPRQSPRNVQPQPCSLKPAQIIPVEKKSPVLKKKSPVIARKPGRSSRLESLLNDMQTESPKRIAPKNKTRSPKKVCKGLNRSTTSNMPTETLNSTLSSAITIPACADTSMGSSNFKMPFAVAGPSGRNLFDKPSDTAQFKPSEPKVCPVLPSRISSRDPRLNRSGAVSNNLMLKYNNSIPAVTPVQPIASRYSLQNQAHNSGNILSSFNPYNQTENSTKPVAIINHHSFVEGIQDNSCKNANFHGLIKRIVEFFAKWLVEQKKNNRPPDEVANNAANLPLYFNSLDQYISLFYPMLILEIWDTMYDESKIIFEKKRVPNKFYFKILESENHKNMTEYKCESVVNKSSFFPMEGNIAIMDVRNKMEKEMAHMIFGYIHRHKVEELQKNALDPKWKKLSPLWLDNAKLWTFKVWVKNRGDKFVPVLNELMKGNGLCNIRNKVRLVDNFQQLQTSPLCKSLLFPDEKTFTVNYPSVLPVRGFSLSQSMAIVGISSELKKQCLEPKIILLQGPPGTGKTHTIIGLLERLFVKGQRQRILVTTPSNAAIDEIGCRLIDLNNRLKSYSQAIKFVRIGLPSQIDPRMKPFTLDEKANQMRQERLSKKAKNNEEQLQKKQSEIDAYKKKKPDYKIRQKINDLENELKVMKQQFSLQKSQYGTHKNYMHQVLQESEIVLSTLGSCSQAIMTTVFKPFSNVSFTCCIIDEATQCTEIETLQVLNFGIRKLVLVGDHQQLPATVNSKLAVECGFERSMFERFYLYFSKYFNNSPIFMLTEQFRMHSEICRFPSKKFYNNRLITSPTTDITYQNFPIQPYLFYDILVSQESNSFSSKTNQNEALAIVKLCTDLLNLNSRATIGIITPYQAQRSLYADAFGHNPQFKRIEVNTVDGFQGREKDVIIVSCVRANSSKWGIGFLACKKRLNVAITRAKQCLIICGHSDTLMQDSNWRDLIEDARERQLCRPVTGDKDIHLVYKKPHKRKK